MSTASTRREPLGPEAAGAALLTCALRIGRSLRRRGPRLAVEAMREFFTLALAYAQAVDGAPQAEAAPEAVS